VNALSWSLPVLLGGAAGALLFKGNRWRIASALVSQAVATVLVLTTALPIALGGAPLSEVWPWPAPIGAIGLHVDALGAFFLSWSLPLTLLGTLYAAGYLKPYFDKGRNAGPHVALLNFVSLSFVLIYSVQNALVFLLGWETAAVSAWLLVIWDYKNQKIRFAGFNYLVSTHVGLLVLVAAFTLLHSRTNSMVFEDFARFLSAPSPTRAVVFLLLGVAFALKSAFFPFHTWLPRAHSAAPAHVSALMSGVIHKAGLFGFLRFALMLGRPEEWMGWVTLGFGALSAVTGVLATSSQRDLKRLLGYSSTENVGIAAMGFGVGLLGWTWGLPALSALGFGGGLLHLLNHALFKCLLFYAAGAIYKATHTVDLERLGGLAKKLPWTAFFFLVGALAICALPPLNGFASELLVYQGLLSGRAPAPEGNAALLVGAALLAFVGAVSALSMTRAFGLAFLGAPRDASLHPSADAPRTMALPMALHALGVVAAGFAPELALRLVGSAAALFPVDGSALSALQAVAPVNRALFGGLVAVALVAVARSRTAPRSVTWGCGYTAPNPRMQYTGSSFSEQLTRTLAPLMPALRRERLPQGPFPKEPGHVSTHFIDAVERRLLEALGQGEKLVARAAKDLPDQPRVAFAAGLVMLLLVGALVAGGLTP
jgi:hydrogenase-4 component B